MYVKALRAAIGFLEQAVVLQQQVDGGDADAGEGLEERIALAFAELMRADYNIDEIVALAKDLL